MDGDDLDTAEIRAACDAVLHRESLFLSADAADLIGVVIPLLCDRMDARQARRDAEEGADGWVWTSAGRLRRDDVIEFDVAERHAGYARGSLRSASSTGQIRSAYVLLASGARRARPITTWAWLEEFLASPRRSDRRSSRARRLGESGGGEGYPPAATRGTAAVE